MHQTVPAYMYQRYQIVPPQFYVKHWFFHYIFHMKCPVPTEILFYFLILFCFGHSYMKVAFFWAGCFESFLSWLLPTRWVPTIVHSRISTGWVHAEDDNMPGMPMGVACSPIQQLVWSDFKIAAFIFILSFFSIINFHWNIIQALL